MIRSVEEFVVAVREDSRSWPVGQPRWFRGEPDSKTPLLPTLYRRDTGHASENQLLQMFRARASGFSADRLPDREKVDQWLFLAQHVGLPTRLLDWSESALMGLYFALATHAPAIVWMLNPLQLNYHASVPRPEEAPEDLREFPLAWHRRKAAANPAAENIHAAWEYDGSGVELPMAILPTYVHARLRAQHGCFTVHGKSKESLVKLAPEGILKRYALDPECQVSMLRELTVLGITEAVAFPDLVGLAKDLKRRFYEETTGRQDVERRPEYDFASMKGGVRGKYHRRFQAGTNIVRLAPELAKVFPTDEAVNEALRTVVRATRALRRATTPRVKGKTPKRRG
jgi:hypothetical protein